jgi:ankyrin repeat protein
VSGRIPVLLLALSLASLVPAGAAAQAAQTAQTVEHGTGERATSDSIGLPSAPPIRNAGDLIALIDQAAPILRRHAGIDAAPSATSAEFYNRRRLTYQRMRRAAQYGYANAQYNLARLLLRDVAIEQNRSEAAEWLQRSAERGYLRAQLLLGYLALRGGSGNDGSPDLARAELWWWAAELQNNTLAKSVRERLAPLMRARDVSGARRLKSAFRSLLPLLPRAIRGSAMDRSEANESFRQAAASGDLNSLLGALSQGVDVDGRDTEGKTAMINAAWRGRDEIVKILLDRGADIEIPDNRARTPLIWGAINGRGGIVLPLIDAGADPGRTDKGGVSALMRAAWNGHLEVVDHLLKGGADPAQRDEKGLTALDYATREGHRKIISRLRNAAPVH